MLKKCALCDENITAKNNSNEHVILNAIGGKKTISDFICKLCNNKSGREWDVDLARQLNPLSLFFRINRERGEVPGEIFSTTGGEQYMLNSDGSMKAPKPYYKEKPCETSVQIRINARDIKEARKMLIGVKRKYLKVDVEEILNSAKSELSYSPDPIQFHLSIGGEKAGRSIVKSALALAVEAGVSPGECEHAQNYLLNANGEACFGYYHENDLVLNRPADIPLHCVYVRGSSSTGLLIGYIEFFGIQRMISCLSSSYVGEDFESLYAIDPVSGIELALDINLDFNIEDIHACYRYEKIPDDWAEKALSNVIPAHVKLHQQQERARVIKSAVEKGFKNCGAVEGEILTPEEIKKLVEIIIPEIIPVLFHQLGLNKKRV